MIAVCSATGSLSTQNDSSKGSDSSSIRPPSQYQPKPQPPETPTLDFDIETFDWSDLFSEHTYVITYYTELEYNNSVGDEWRKGVIYNGEKITNSSRIVVDESTTEIEIVAYATELDKWNDYGEALVTFDALEKGQKQTKWVTFIVREDEGRYAGNTAKWYFEITIERIQ